jgi:hypothetical protein
VSSRPRDGRRPPAMMPALGPVTSSVVFHGIAGAPDPPANANAWSEVLPTLLREGLAGLALDALDGIEMPDGDAIRSTLLSAHRAEIAMSSIARSKAGDVIGILDAAGIGSVVIKGPAIAARYPRPAARPFEDLDLVVPTERFADALEALEAVGFVSPPAPRAWFARRCREGVNLWRRDGASVDVHHRIPPWAFGRRLTFGRLRRDAVSLRIGDADVTVASDAHNTLIAALQLVGFRTASAMKLKAWRDVYELSRVVDPRVLASESRAVDLGWYLASILAELPTYARPTDLLTALDDDSVAPPWKRARLRAVVPPSIGARNFSVGRVFRLPVSNGLAYLVAKAVPSRSFLTDVYGSPWAYLRWWRGAQEHLLDSAAPGVAPPT